MSEETKTAQPLCRLDKVKIIKGVCAGGVAYIKRIIGECAVLDIPPHDPIYNLTDLEITNDKVSWW